MYSGKVESYLANSIEDPAKAAIEAIRTQRDLTPDLRHALAKYILMLWKRVPQARKRVATMMPTVVSALEADIVEKIDHLSTADPTVKGMAERRKAEVRRIFQRYSSDPPPAIWQRSLLYEGRQDAVNALESMNWTFLHSSELQFITCDNPVFFFAHEGLRSEQSELTIPLSSNIALWANRRYSSQLNHAQATKQIVKEINRRSAHNASRFIFAKEDESWILPFSLRGSYSLNRIK